MDSLGINICEFWNIFFDEFGFWIELLGLKKWVEYTDWFWISSYRRTPLPISIVHCFIIVDEIPAEPVFSYSPIDPEILREE